ncbi:Substrate-specific component BioY of biotin ECF transporter [Clostridiaceae bacterium JG1575]|nr:Substrate-specific component BioY of biotin ECF transporter [Clostridiaceae bacterium JG1575]
MTAKKKISTKHLILIPLFSALICVGAFLKIPIGPVPMTLQTIFVLLAGLLLGPVRGMAAVALYVLMGLLGVPVFTSGGGPAYLLHPTFGYLLGMIVAAGITGAIAAKSHSRNIAQNFLASLLGLFVIYLFGLLWLYGIRNWYLAQQIPFGVLLRAGVLVFLPADVFWCAAASILARRIAPHRL